ncbi:MAG TPA: N-acetylmuramoyl-L-alanine amidase-like domain-containing protein [Bacteroidota bacterium]|nr:N-acetylmuramoyl-L-alanine amidase-like domain-containing protein [Bacteroidota bacterium]
MNRRDFIGRGALAALVPLLSARLNTSFGSALFATPDDADETICGKKFSLALSDRLEDKPINQAIVEIGKSFIGTDYAEHTLEEGGEEHLVVNLRVLDCVSFYENVLALARCVKMKTLTFEAYKAQLQFIRYRGGVIDGYASRLHYTTDYWFDNEKKGVLKVVTKELFGEKAVQRIPTPINFMSTHRRSYRQLSDDSVLAEIEKREQEIGKREMFFLPKESVHLFADRVKTGSLIGITTSIPGLDVSHTGIALRTESGSLHLLHAPDVGQKVQITKMPLHEYLARNTKQTGIIVAEALEPHR